MWDWYERVDIEEVVIDQDLEDGDIAYRLC